MSFRNFGHESFPSHFSSVNSPSEFPDIVSFGCLFSRDLNFSGFFIVYSLDWMLELLKLAPNRELSRRTLKMQKAEWK